MPKSSSSSFPWVPILLGASLLLHVLTLGHFFYVQTLTESAFATIATKFDGYDATLEEHGDDIAKNYVQHYNDNFMIRQDLSDLYGSAQETWTSPYSIPHGNTRLSFSYLEPSEVISNPGDTDPEFVANYQDAYSVFYAINIEDVVMPEIGFEDTQSMCDYFSLGSEAMTYGSTTFCGLIEDEVSHNVPEREATYLVYQGGLKYTLTFTARSGGTCQNEKELTPECEEKYFAPLDNVMATVLSSFTIEAL